jgi:3-methylcrotonyl-CoA carboxylase beta subunit
MTVLKSSLSCNSEEFVANNEAMSDLVRDLRDKVETIIQGGGKKARGKHLARGKLLPRERIRQLLDVGSPFGSRDGLQSKNILFPALL